MDKTERDNGMVWTINPLKQLGNAKNMFFHKDFFKLFSIFGIKQTLIDFATRIYA